MKSLEHIFDDISDKEYQFLKVAIIFKSPITDDYDYRVAYFTDNVEAHIWEDQMVKMYHHYEHVVHRSIIRR